MDKARKIKVKVCGITRLEDALALDARGVDYLGFNFWPGSKRFIAPEAAAEIIRQLRHAEPVGVFVDHAPEEIAGIAARSGIRAVQLHGSEGWDALEKITLPVIKAVPHTRLGDWGGLRGEWNLRSGQPRHFLVDTQAVEAFGGTGAAFDWSLLGRPGPSTALRDHGSPLPRPFFLAGGLGPDNVAEAVRIAHPFAVDLNSKVESAPGVKDVDAVERCLKILSGA